MLATHQIAAVFPGQGSQTSTMGEEVRSARPDLHALACDLTGTDPFARAGESTRFAQPAILCASLVGWGRLRAGGGPQPLALAGHSLGELSALAAAGVLAEEDAVRLAAERGRLMADAGEAAGGGSMLALLGATPTRAARLAAAHGLVVANDNAPGQQVLSGGRDGLKLAAKAARADGLRSIELDVAGAFHSPQMAGAEAGFREALAAVEIREAQIKVLCCGTAKPFTDVREQLAVALTTPVRWRETMVALDAAGAEHFVDVGPGKVLAKLVARNVTGATAGGVEVAGAAV